MNCTKPFRLDGSGGPSLRQLEEALQQVNAPVLQKKNPTKKQMCNSAKHYNISIPPMELNDSEKECASSNVRTVQSLLDDIYAYNNNNPDDLISVKHKNKAELCRDVVSRDIMELPSPSPVLSRRSMSKVTQCSKPRSDKLNNMSKEDLVLLAKEYNETASDRSKIKNVAGLKKADLCKRLQYRGVLPDMAPPGSNVSSVASVPSLASVPSHTPSVIMSQMPRSIPVSSPMRDVVVEEPKVSPVPNWWTPSARKDTTRVDDSKYGEPEMDQPYVPEGILQEQIRVVSDRIRLFLERRRELETELENANFEFESGPINKQIHDLNEQMEKSRHTLSRLQQQLAISREGRRMRLPSSKKSCNKHGHLRVESKGRKSHCRRKPHSVRK